MGPTTDYQLSIIFYFHLKNQTRYSAITYRVIEMVSCQKSKCSLRHLHALLIFKHLYPHSHKHTVNQQYKQVKGPNNIIMQTLRSSDHSQNLNNYSCSKAYPSQKVTKTHPKPFSNRQTGKLTSQSNI